MQVVRDLCTVCQADGHTTDAEVDQLLQIAHDLEVSATFVHQTLSDEPELD